MVDDVCHQEVSSQIGLLAHLVGNAAIFFIGISPEEEDEGGVVSAKVQRPSVTNALPERKKSLMMCPSRNLDLFYVFLHLCTAAPGEENTTKAILKTPEAVSSSLLLLLLHFGSSKKPERTYFARSLTFPGGHPSTTGPLYKFGSEWTNGTTLTDLPPFLAFRTSTKSPKSLPENPLKATVAVSVGAGGGALRADEEAEARRGDRGSPASGARKPASARKPTKERSVTAEAKTMAKALDLTRMQKGCCCCCCFF